VCAKRNVCITVFPVGTQQCSVCIVGLHVAVNSINLFCTKILLWRFYDTGNNKTYRGLHARKPNRSFSYFIQIRNYSALFHNKSP